MTNGSSDAQPNQDCAEWASHASDYVGVGAGLLAASKGAPEAAAAVGGVAAAHYSEPYLEQVCQWAEAHYAPATTAPESGAFNCAKSGDCDISLDHLGTADHSTFTDTFSSDMGGAGASSDSGSHDAGGSGDHDGGSI